MGTVGQQLSEFGFAWLAGDFSGLGWPEAGPSSPVRDVLSSASWLGGLARNRGLVEYATEALGGPAFPVRANLFAKAAGSNWSVPWHQDLVVCVDRRVEFEGFTGWSTKAGLWHANAPLAVLDRMVSLRLHLDPCPETVGPPEVLAGTHRKVMSSEERAIATQGPTTLLPACKGAVLAMKPLLLHRSASSESCQGRRVLHIEYAVDPLPEPLKWKYGEGEPKR